MTKTIFAFAAALLAGTTMTSVANADAVRVGFGFPLGSFVAHSNETYSGRDYRPAERSRVVRRDYQDDLPARKAVKAKRPVRSEDAEAAPKVSPTPTVQTVKLESKLESNPATTTVIEKSPAAKSDAAAASTTTGSISSATNTLAVNGDKNAAKADAQSASADAATKHVCRRYSPAIAALVDVPCD
jgi:hypothetical protein